MFFPHQILNRYATIVVLPLLLSGCGSVLSGAGPSRVAINTNADEQNYALVDLTAATIGRYMRPPEKISPSTIARLDVPEIRLVPGDVLRVMVADSVEEGGLFARLANGGTVFEHIRVDSKGTISVPYGGRIKVHGLTLSDVEALIRKKLAPITTDVQVQVGMTGDLSGSVLVAGAVKSPGRFSALEGPLTLLDAINRAGGPIMEPHLIRVVVRTGKAAYDFNYEELLSGKNQVVPPGAEIILERARKRFVAMGSVGDPGLHDLPSNNPSLLEVLGSVKGLNEAKADASGVFVFRLTDPAPDALEGTRPRAEVFRLNMKEPAAMFIARQFLVRPEDAIYVTNAAVYEWQKIITPIVQVLVLGRTINNGF